MYLCHRAVYKLNLVPIVRRRCSVTRKVTVGLTSSIYRIKARVVSTRPHCSGGWYYRQTHTRCAGMGWDRMGWDGREIVVASDRSCDGMEWTGMGCAGNSVYFSGSLHTLNLSQHPNPSNPIPSQRVCVNAPLPFTCRRGQRRKCMQDR